MKKRVRPYEKWELKILKDDSLTNRQVANLLHRSWNGVWLKRRKLKGLKPDYNKKYNQHYYKKSPMLKAKNRYRSWTKEECQLIINSSESDIKLAQRLGRTIRAIQMKRWYLLHTSQGESAEKKETKNDSKR